MYITYRGISYNLHSAECAIPVPPRRALLPRSGPPCRAFRAATAPSTSVQVTSARLANARGRPSRGHADAQHADLGALIDGHSGGWSPLVCRSALPPFRPSRYPTSRTARARHSLLPTDHIPESPGTPRRGHIASLHLPHKVLRAHRDAADEPERRLAPAEVALHPPADRAVVYEREVGPAPSVEAV